MAGSVLVSGAARGFGRALLEVFLNDGWRVLALTRREADAERLNAAFPQWFTAFAADVTSEHVGERIGEVLDSEQGALELLVNNAGRSGSLMSIDALEPVALGDMLDLHCLGAARCARAALPYLRRAEHGLLVNVSSRLGSLQRNASGRFPAGRYSYDYRIAKAAQNMLTLCLSSELAGSGVSVCALHPGRLKTETGGEGADTPPAEAAARFLAFVNEATPEVNGRFFDLFGGEIPW